MRENMGLYRGKRRDTGEWVEGYLAGYDLICTEEPQDVRHATGEYYDQIAYVGFVEVDPDTVGQFTGLPDKDGKRIFEGDILEHHVQGNILVNRGVVNWDARNGRWAHQMNTMNPCFYMHNPDAFEVIGNRFDNPELLEVTPDE